MLAALQSWVADYYKREDAWSYNVHRRIFDNYQGSKVEHTTIAQVTSLNFPIK